MGFCYKLLLSLFTIEKLQNVLVIVLQGYLNRSLEDSAIMV